MGILDKVSGFVQGEQGQNLINKISGSKQDSSDSGTANRDESAIQRDESQSFGGPTSGFDSTSERYTSQSSGGPQGENPSYGGASSGFDGTSSRYTSDSNANADKGAGADKDDDWEDDEPAARRSSSRPKEHLYSSSRGDFSPTGAAYGTTATPRYGAREAGADGAFLGEPEEREDEQRNNPFGEGRDEQPGYEGGSEERFDSSYGGGDRGLDFVASGGASAYGDGLNEFGGAGRNNDGAGRSSYEPDQPAEQHDGYRGGERSAYP